MNIENDKLIMMLLLHKNIVRKLSFFEKKHLKIYKKIFHLNSDENLKLQKVLHQKYGFLQFDVPQKGDTTTESYKINNRGLHALKTHFFQSEMSATKETKRSRMFMYIARIITIISALLAIYFKLTNIALNNEISDNQSTIERLNSKIDSLKHELFKLDTIKSGNK